MLSTKTTARIMLGLALILVFTAGSEELRIAVATILSWAIGQLLLLRFALPTGFRRAFHAYFTISFGLLGATNDLFCEQTFGRFWDLWLARSRWDLDTRGSGFTEWHETLRRQRHEELVFALRFLRFAVLCLLVLALLVVLAFTTVILVRVANEAAERDRPFEEAHRAHEEALRRQFEPAPPAPKRDSRNVRWSDEALFLSERGVGFKRVIADDYHAAVSRRGILWKDFS